MTGRAGAWILVAVLTGVLSRSGPAPPSGPWLVLLDGFRDDPCPTPALVRAASRLQDLPVDGIALHLHGPGVPDVTGRAFSRERVRFDEMAAALAPLRGHRFRRLSRNFVLVRGGRPPDFFDDWSVPVANFGDLARACRDAGLAGIVFDNEGYDARWGDHPEGVRHPGRPVREYRDQARQRGREMMTAACANYPGIAVITLHGPYVSEPAAPPSLFPQWQTHNELLGPFFAGFAEAVEGPALCVDGGELYHLRTPESFRSAREWRKAGIVSPDVDCLFISGALKRRWAEAVSVGFGVYDRPFGGADMDPAILRRTLAQALSASDHYVWLYLEGTTFLEPREGGQAWIQAVRDARRDARARLVTRARLRRAAAPLPAEGQP